MTSGKTCSVSDRATLVFLDANVLAKPVTRTLLIAGAEPSGFRVVWSLAAEEEASRHMRPRAVSPGIIRQGFGVALTPVGEVGVRFSTTKGADRQILADADAAGAAFLITEDVDDFALEDLVSVGLSAVNPDRFLAEWLTREAYARVINLFVERQVNPPTTAARFHATIARNHPLLFAEHADLFDVEPVFSEHDPPAVLFRGPRCLRCGRLQSDPDGIVGGLCPECRAPAG